MRDTLPDQKELEKELNEYLARKYGDRIKVAMPLVVPQRDEGVSERGSGKEKRYDKIRFDLKPEELEAHLNEFIVKQDDAKEILATKICTHFNRIKYWEYHKSREQYDGVGMIKNNIIMIRISIVPSIFISLFDIASHDYK